MSREMLTIDNEKMPSPDAVVRYHDGQSGPAMFHYSHECADFKAIATEHGFDISMVFMSDDLPDNHALSLAYFHDGALEEVLGRWRPKPPVGEGWSLCGKHDTEDGPVALFLRKLPDAQ